MSEEQVECKDSYLHKNKHEYAYENKEEVDDDNSNDLSEEEEGCIDANIGNYEAEDNPNNDKIKDEQNENNEDNENNSSSDADNNYMSHTNPIDHAQIFKKLEIINEIK